MRSWEGILAPGTSTLLLVQCCDSGKQDPLGPLVVGDRPANGARWRVEVLAGFHTLDALDAKVREQKTKTKRARFYNPLQPLLCVLYVLVRIRSVTASTLAGSNDVRGLVQL